MGGADGDTLLAAVQAVEPAAEARATLADFEEHACPGVPIVMVFQMILFATAWLPRLYRSSIRSLA